MSIPKLQITHGIICDIHISSILLKLSMLFALTSLTSFVFFIFIFYVFEKQIPGEIYVFLETQIFVGNYS
jgi:hypothetical protein